MVKNPEGKLPGGRDNSKREPVPYYVPPRRSTPYYEEGSLRINKVPEDIYFIRFMSGEYLGGMSPQGIKIWSTHEEDYAIKTMKNLCSKGMECFVEDYGLSRCGIITKEVDV